MTTRVLMVDDEPDAQELFRQNFRREIRKGIYSFDFAQSGQQALDILTNGTPRAALCAAELVKEDVHDEDFLAHDPLPFDRGPASP